MSSPIYRWTLEIEGGATHDASPRYDGGAVNVEKNQEPGQMFFRTKLSGSLNFLRADYEFILTATIEDKILIVLEEFTGTWDALFQGFFYRTDCEIDEDNKKVTVSPTPNDEYEAVLNGMDKEFDLIKLEVPSVPVLLWKHPVFQFYVLGTSRITNVVGASYWDQDVIEPIYDAFDMESVYFFGSPGFTMIIPGDATVLSPDVSGQYVYNGTGNNYVSVDGDHEIRLNPAVSMPDIQWEIIETAGSTALYRKPLNEGLVMPNQFEPHPVPFESLTTSDECRVFLLAVYCRILTDNTSTGGGDNHAVPDPDIIEANPNYTRVVAFDLSDDVLIPSSEHQPAATIYGKFPTAALHFGDEYFVRPVPSPAVGTLFPLLRYLWEEFSAWVYFDSDMLDLQTSGAEVITIQECYKLPDIIAAILGEVAPTIQHEESAGFSDFFYGLTNPIRGDVKYPLFTPKSNVTIGNYDVAASRAPITLRELLDFLAQSPLSVYWFIDNGDFILEHVAYFENGKSYTTAGVGVDLTTLLEPKTGRSWGDRANRYKYEKQQLPQEIRWSWMDNVSAGFLGYPVQMRSAYVQKGNIEERSLALFTSDVDLAISQAASISPDGFFFFEALESETPDLFYLPFVAFDVSDEETYNMQNGYASLVFMVDAYFRERLPASLVTINKADDIADSVKRSKVQEIEFPSGVDPDPMLLVTTGLGTGKVRAMTINLSSRGNKMTIYHDTE